MLRVLAFTDEPVVATGLRSVLTRRSGFRLTSVAGLPANLVEAALAAKPHLILLDMNSDMTFGVIADLLGSMPEARVVLWVRSISNETAYQSIEHGIRGILRKNLSTETLLRCLQVVAKGGLWFEEGLKEGFGAAEAVTLSPRESQLVTLLAQGLKNKEIAELLSISAGTVKVYLSRLFRKLDVNDRFELALYGLKNLPGMQSGQELRPQRNERARLKKDAAQTGWLRSLLLSRPVEKPRVVS